MNVKGKRFWLVTLLRLPNAAEQVISNFIHRIPERVRFWINFSLLVLATAFLVSHHALSSWLDVRRFPGMIVTVATIFFALYKASERSRSLRLPLETTFWVTGTAILFQLVLVRAGSFMATMLSHSSEMDSYDGIFGFQLAIPFATATLILSLLVGSQLALLSAFIVSLFVAMVTDGGIATAWYSLISSVAAISGIERYRTRNAISLAIPIIGGANIVMSLLVPLIANQPLTGRIALNSAVLGLLSALQATAIASLVTPLYESAFGIMTDMKLMELSNADNPLLRELAIRTPGTNHHSFIVATLAESAAKAIGANALLARTACLYHDIGKMAAPKMYIENQNGMENPHNNVAACDSVRIITGHVRRGIKLGQEAGLPQQIIDFIPQHHGTRILAYFYHKAKSQAEARGETVNADDFRYPGPKPQTKEAVIVMLSDGAEAAVRSLQDHSEEYIRAIIKKIIDHIVADGQFDESDVTLQELNTIRESLIATLTSIHHQRVSYPGFNPPSQEEQINALANTFKNGDKSLEPPPPSALTPDPKITLETE